MEEEVIFKIDIPAESITSIENLTKSSKALREERKKLNLETAEGQKRATEINKQLDANTEIIKKNSSALEKQRLNIGNYSSALDKVIPGLGGMITGIGGMTKAALAFIATPLGAVLAALGVALAALTSYFKGSEEGQLKLNRIMDIGSAIVGKFSDLIQFLGGTLFKTLAAGFETIIGFLDKWVPGFKEATEAFEKFLNLDVAAHISSLEEERVALNRLLIVERGRLRNEIEAAKLRAESTKNVKERTAALAEVEKLTNELFDKESRLAQLEKEIAIENGKLANNTIEDNDKIAEAIAKVDDIERQRSAALKENATKQLAVNEQARMALEKERDEVVKLANEENIREGNKVLQAAAQEERHQRELEQINERIQAYVSEEEVMRRRIEVLDLESDLADESADANSDLEKELKKISKARAEEARNAAFQDSARQQSLSIAQQVAGQSKEISTGIALISTYFAAQKAFESQFLPVPDPSSPIRGGIAAAIAVASGLARVAQINNIGFADGGLVPGFAMGGLSGTRIMGHHGVPINRSNGDNRLATVRTGEVILNEQQQARLGGERTFRSIGVPGFASGGYTGAVSAAAQRAESASIQREVFEAVSRIRPIVTVEDINAGQSRVDIVDSRAQII